MAWSGPNNSESAVTRSVSQLSQQKLSPYKRSITRSPLPTTTLRCEYAPFVYVNLCLLEPQNVFVWMDMSQFVKNCDGWLLMDSDDVFFTETGL